MFLASSLSEFKQQFEQHLIHMLASDSLGAFILVLANSMQDDRNLFGLSTENSHLPGFGLAYNSLGAHASVNHLHFQGYIRDREFPLEAAHWRHNGGDVAYPLDCHRCDNEVESWGVIEQLHTRNQPYNLLYRNGYCYILPQKRPGARSLASGFAKYGLARIMWSIYLGEPEFGQHHYCFRYPATLQQLRV